MAGIKELIEKLAEGNFEEVDSEESDSEEADSEEVDSEEVDSEEEDSEEVDSEEVNSEVEDSQGNETDDNATYTVTFMYQGKVFATQVVNAGETVTKPTLVPAPSGKWDFDFSTPIEGDVEIKFVE